MSAEAEHPVVGPLSALIDAWCQRRDLQPLATLLPAYVSNPLRLTDDWALLMDALRDLRRQRSLPEAEQADVARVLVIVEQAVYRR